MWESPGPWCPMSLTPHPPGPEAIVLTLSNPFLLEAVPRYPPGSPTWGVLSLPPGGHSSDSPEPPTLSP